MVLTLIFTKEFLFVNPFNLVLLIELLYNLIIAVLLFFLIKLKKLKWKEENLKNTLEK